VRPYILQFIKAWYEACVNAVDWEVDMFTTIDQCFDSVDAMGTLDWATLVFASYVVALTVIGELKDMLLCDIAVKRLDDKLGSWRHAIAIAMAILCGEHFSCQACCVLSDCSSSFGVGTI
jgi:hypothetical protein